jgi:hypothetical protein
LRVAAAQTGTLDELRTVQTQVDRLVQAGTTGTALAEARALQRLIQAVIGSDDAGQEIPFRSAELARDSLRAPQLAEHLFLTFARERPASLFAPKALIDAAAEDSLARALGVAVAAPSALVVSLVRAPVPGPRGPLLDADGPGRAEPSRLPGRRSVRGDDAPRDDRRRPPSERP